MHDLSLSLDKLVRAVKASASLRFGQNIFPVMQEFIASRLARPNPPLSEKVRRLDPSKQGLLLVFKRHMK